MRPLPLLKAKSQGTSAALSFELWLAKSAFQALAKSAFQALAKSAFQALAKSLDDNPHTPPVPPREPSVPLHT